MWLDIGYTLHMAKIHGPGPGWHEQLMSLFTLELGEWNTASQQVNLTWMSNKDMSVSRPILTTTKICQPHIGEKMTAESQILKKSWMLVILLIYI